MTKKSERYRIEEMKCEKALQMQREKLLAEAFLQPPGIYLVGLGGAVVMEFFSAIMTPPEKRTLSQHAHVEAGLISLISPVGGVYTWVAQELQDQLKHPSEGTNPLGSIVSLAAAGGASLFIALLILNEMKPDGGGNGGGAGALGTLLGLIA